MDNQTLNVELQNKRESLAVAIADQYTTWATSRNRWIAEKEELRNYIFATDTRKTANAKLPWKNSTTIPKLCQIRDNLHANYMAALFPNDNWLSWEAADSKSDAIGKKKAILAYMRAKTRTSQFRQTVSQMVYDFIDYGNVFGDADYVREVVVDDETGEETQAYVGPRLRRVSPLDVVFNPVAVSFEKSPKIIRRQVTYGTLAKMARTITDPDIQEAFEAAVQRSKDMRQWASGMTTADKSRISAFSIDGFGSLSTYLEGDLVELLEFEGDLYDTKTGELHENRQILVIDRSFVLMNRNMKSWLGQSTKKHAGWRLRPDNLYAMGPLDNLVGMQYRIDHLENLKADIFDLIAHPVLKITGMVEGVKWEPGANLYVGDDGDIQMLNPDTTALNADMQIRLLEDKMEEMAGAPRQAMGIRTPGEKTAYEVQTLENAAGRIFQNKISYFEEQFLEPLLNVMLAEARKNLDTADIIRVVEDDLGVTDFITVTKDDLTAQGVLRPMGARHFAAKAQLVQNLTNLYNSALGQDQQVMVHFSGKRLAKLIEEQLNLEQYNLYEENVRVIEQAETAQLMQAAQDEVANDSMVDTQGPPPEEEMV